MRKRNVAILLLLSSLLPANLGLPARGSEGVDLKFFTSCRRSHAERSDPIVAPGVRSAHRHEFFGNRSTTSDSTLKTMRKAGTTCSTDADTSGYWVPTLRAPDGSRARASSVNAYYRAVGALAGSRIEPFPPDLRMVASRYYYHCGATGMGSPRPVDCGAGYLKASVVFPACWDGVRTDSPDHLSHMAYQTGRGCPDSHPVALPRLVLVSRYPGVHDGRGYRLSSGGPRTMHADFWNTWDQQRLSKIVGRCLNGTVSCDLVT